MTRFDGDPHAVPMALSRLHRGLPVGGRLEVTLPVASWPGARLRDVVVGAGFTEISTRRAGDRWAVTATRARTLADTVGPDMGLLVCGLNPSLYSADAGVGYARPGNRFWPAALAAGLVARDRDPDHALVRDGAGMTDLVKRASTGAAELTADEYRGGLGRVERLVEWLRPAVVCFVGLAGWRAAVDRRATAGPQGDLGGAAVYVMPSTSGLNAHASLDELVGHLRAAASLVPAPRPTQAPAPAPAPGDRRPVR